MTHRSPAWHRSLPGVAVGTVLLVAVLIVAKRVIVPLAVALLLTFVLSPVVAAVQRLGMKRLYAVLLTTALAFATLGGVGWAVARQVEGLAVQMTEPARRQQVRDKFDELRGSGGGAFGELVKMAEELASDAPPEAATRPVVVAQSSESGLARLLETVEQVVAPLASAGLVVILVIFMLVNKEDLRDRLIALAGHGRLSSTTKAMEDAGDRVGRYLLSVLALNSVYGVVFAAGLWVLGVPFAFLWGFLAAVLGFIPFLGTWAAATFPVLLSVTLSAGWSQPLAVFLFFVTLDLFSSNVVEPLLFGHGTGVSPIALLVAAAFWAWVWGTIGLLLSTPLTVCLVVLGSHVPRLGFLSLLLGNAPALPPPARLYQRLFARDKREAGARVAEYVAAHGAEKAFDAMVVPALVMARRDRARGDLNPEGEEFALAATREIVDVVGPRAGVPKAETAVVVACPAHHPAEEAALDMLAHILAPDGVRVDALTARNLPSDVADRVGKDRPAAVYIAVLPPGGLPQAAYLCRLLRKRYPGLKIVVGWLGSERNFDKVLVKMRKAGASYVTTSLHQSRSQLRFVAQAATPTEGGAA